MAKPPSKRQESPHSVRPDDVFRRPWEWEPISREVARTLVGRTPVVVAANRNASWFRPENPLYGGVGPFPLSALRYYRYTGVSARKGGGTSGAARKAEPPPEPPPAEAPVPELTWIEIELVDSEGRAVPAAKYAIELPDGSVRRGQLDAGGRARVDGIQPGLCNVSFPALQASDLGPP